VVKKTFNYHNLLKSLKNIKPTQDDLLLGLPHVILLLVLFHYNSKRHVYVFNLFNNNLKHFIQANKSLLDILFIFCFLIDC